MKISRASIQSLYKDAIDRTVEAYVLMGSPCSHVLGALNAEASEIDLLGA